MSIFDDLLKKYKSHKAVAAALGVDRKTWYLWRKSESSDPHRAVVMLHALKRGPLERLKKCQ